MPFASQNLSYDGLGRIKEITLGEKLSKNICYAQYGDHSTNRISSVWYGVNGIRKDNSRYTYDKAGNILTVTENGKLSARYRYDGLNRLIREDNAAFGTFTYSYNENGNILNKTVYGYTLAETLEGGIEHVYAYKQNGWKDQLVLFDDQSCSYDAIGNPTVYRGSAAVWRGRRLVNYKGVSYSYDANGIRTDKSVNGVTVKYVCDGTTILAEQRSNSSSTQWLYYIYGADGVAGFTVNGEEYLYRKNIQGDVTHVYKKDGTLVALYSYDAWGNCKVFRPDGSPDEDEGSVGNANPFRYRSYYFDEETGLYYLNSRYYDPETGRFVNADDISFLDPESINGLNLYAYCGDNPVMNVDYLGTSPNGLKKLLSFIERVFTGLSELCKYIIKHPEQFSVSWKQHHKIYPKDSFRSFIRTNESNFAQTKSLSKTFGKIATAIAFVSLAIDIGISWYDNYKNNENWISDSIVDTIYIGTRFAISWGINAVCSLIPGFGWLIGIGVSIGVDYLIQLTMENGVLDNIKNWAAKTWESVVDGWNYFWSFDWI